MHPSAGILSNDSSFATLDNLNVDSTFGAMYLSNVVVAMLFTLTTVQLHIYHQRNQEDSRSMKLLVYFLWVLDALHFALTTYANYGVVIHSIGNPATGLRVSWGSRAALVIAGSSDTIITFVLARRLWKFGRQKRIIQGIVVSPSVANAACPVIECAQGVIGVGNLVVTAADIAMVVLTLRPGVNSFTFGIPWLWCGAFSLRASVDVLIACTITCMLYECRKYAKRTKSVIYLIMLYSVSTCTLTTVCVIIAVITFVALPNTFVSYAVMQTLPKLMLNALFVLLNSRQTLRSMVDRAQMHPTGLSPVQWQVGNCDWAGQDGLDTKSNAALNVSREVTVPSLGEPLSSITLSEV